MKGKGSLGPHSRNLTTQGANLVRKHPLHVDTSNI